jgi:glycosyltransferase involved in cell wall biosynthesis
MKAAPFFSIVIPVYNRSSCLAKALDSVLNQSWTNFEVIVVDDGSTDEIDSVAQRYTPRGIKFIKNGTNLGVGNARNKGVREARGMWVAFLDSDSYLVPGALSVLYETIKICDDKVGVVYGKSEQVGFARRTGMPPSGPRRRWNYKQYLQAVNIEESRAVTRREVLVRFPFEENLNIKRECGVLVWYAIGRAGYDFVWTEQLVQQFEISPDGLSGRRFLAAHPEEMVICNEKILECFGDDLVNINKAKLIQLYQKTAFYCLMAGRQPCAVRHVQVARKLDPINLRSWLLMLLCFVGPRTVRRLYPLAASFGT